jgi:hypothetical protein
MHLLLEIQKIFANSRVSYLFVISKVLEYSLDASRDEHIYSDYIYRDGHQEANNYNLEYVAKRTEQEAAAFTANLMDFENIDIHFPPGSDPPPSIETTKLHNEGFSSEPTSKRQYVAVKLTTLPYIPQN